MTNIHKPSFGDVGIVFSRTLSVLCGQWYLLKNLDKIMIKVKSFTGKLQASRLEVFLDAELWGIFNRGGLRCCITWAFFFFIGVLSLCSENTFKDNKITYRMHIFHVFFILCIFFVLYHFNSYFKGLYYYFKTTFIWLCPFPLS